MSGRKLGGRSGFRTTLLMAMLASGLLLLTTPVRAQEDQAQENQASDGETSGAEGGKQDLLLFWEEKELYVETATRTAKPISQVAENMEVITAKDIEDMNAHTVNEVLNRVPGLFVDFGTNDFDSPAQIHIQGGASRHVTVLLDGVVWNFLTDGHAETISIPVGIIDRIEIIKGPASSAWGSGLSGVVNIITKGTGDTTIPKGAVFTSYGQRDTRDLNAQLFGKAGGIGYFLHAGRLASDGLALGRNSQNDSLYGKISLSPVHNLDVTLSAGYSTPENGEGAQHNPTPFGMIDTVGSSKLRAFHAASALEYRFSPDLTLKAEANTVRFSFDSLTNFTSPVPALNIQSGDVTRSNRSDEHKTSGNVKLVYTAGMHSAVAGFEASNGKETLDSEMPWRGLGGSVHGEVSRWAVFTNDTLTLGDFAVTPGIRYDHDSIAGDFVSPSLGATYQFTEHSIARASIAKGFTRPPLAMTSGGGPFYKANPDLTTEQGWSYQVGVESAIKERVNVKATLFRHDIDNAISDAPDRTADKYVNVGKIVRQGYEVVAETAPVYNTSLKASNTYVHIDPDAPFKSTKNYSYQVAVKYDDRSAWLGQLAGTYIWWGLPPGVGKYDNFIWDANVNRRFTIGEERNVELFFTIHNIFNTAYTTQVAQPNAGRWVEGGLKCRF